MSMLISVTYINADVPISILFEAVADIFRREVADHLYAPPLASDNTWHKCDPAMSERFLGPGRAGFVQKAMNETYYYGVRIYPQRRGLFTLMDSVVTWDVDIFGSSRAQCTETRALLEREPEAIQYNHLPTFMHFQAALSKRVAADLVHVMAVSQAAGEATGIHFYSAGEFADNYYVEDLQEWHPRELPQHPELIRKTLGGRFKFLLRLPRPVTRDEDIIDEYFFAHRHYPLRIINHRTGQMEDRDPFGLRRRGLYVPSWDKKLDPYGAVYCQAQHVPDRLYEEYGIERRD